MLVAFALGGVLMGVIAARLAANVEQERASALAAEYFAGRTAAFVREMRDVTEDLQHLRSFFVAVRHVSRAEFGVFAGEILSRHPAIVAVMWAPRVSGADRLRYEREVRADGLPGYAIRVPGPGGAAATAAAKADYYPVLYVEPFEKNRDVLGLDLSSERDRFGAMTRADATGEPSGSPLIDLNQVAGTGKGFLVVMPVGAPIGEAQGLAGEPPGGFVLLTVQVHGIFRDLFERSGPSGGSVMRFELADAGPGADGTPVVIESAPVGTEGALYRDWRYVERFDVGGRRWQLTGRPTAAYVAAHLSMGPVVLGTGLGLIWVLIGGFAVALVRRARDAALPQANPDHRDVAPQPGRGRHRG